MSVLDISQLLQYRYPNLLVKQISKNDIVFEDRIALKCFHCANYNNKWTCPPRIPKIDYKRILDEYENAVVVYCKIEFNKDSFDEVRSSSTNIVHRALLFLESELYNRNNSLAVSFIGGSCKLCKNGCNKERCVNPNLSRIPWEATGCNVVKTLKNIGIEVCFPPNRFLYRFGLFLW